MRNVARLLINIKSLHPSDDEAQLETFISPKYFDTVVEAVHLTAGQIAQKSISHASDDSEHRPSVALKIGHSLGKLAAVKRCQALRQDDSKRENDAENFLKLKEAEWSEKVSSQSLVMSAQRKRNKVSELPDCHDLSKFSSFLANNIKLATDVLKREASDRNFRRCSELVLANLTTFNKRRSGEMEQLK